MPTSLLEPLQLPVSAIPTQCSRRHAVCEITMFVTLTSRYCPYLLPECTALLFVRPFCSSE